MLLSSFKNFFLVQFTNILGHQVPGPIIIMLYKPVGSTLILVYRSIKGSAMSRIYYYGDWSTTESKSSK